MTEQRWFRFRDDILAIIAVTKVCMEKAGGPSKELSKVACLIWE